MKLPDPADEAEVPRILVKLRGSEGSAVQVELPDRFRRNGRFVHTSVGERKKVDDAVAGRPQSRMNPVAPPAAEAVGAAPSQAARARGAWQEVAGSALGDAGVVVGLPARKDPATAQKGPFFEYLSHALDQEVTAIYVTLRADDRSWDKKGRSPNQSGAVQEDFEEGPDGLPEYPFVPGMLVLVDVNARASRDRNTSAASARNESAASEQPCCIVS